MKKIFFVSKLMVLFLLLCGATTFAAAPQTANANRGIAIKNKTPYTLLFAYTYHDETAGAWVCTGWRTVGPGQTDKFRLNTKNKNVYFFAKSGNQFWPSKAETDGAEFSVVDGDFSYKTETEKPEGENTSIQFFKRIKTNLEGNFTLEVTE